MARKLPSKTDDLADIPEADQDLYEKKGDVYVLTGVQAIDGYALADHHGLKSALDSERKKAANGERILKKLGFRFNGEKNDFDGDLDQITGALESWDKVKDIDPEKEAERLAEERANARVAEKERGWEKRNQELERRAENLLGFLEREKKTNAVRAVLAELGGNSKSRLLIPEIEKNLKFRPVEQDGKVTDYEVVVISPDGGGPRFSSAPDAGATQLMDIKEYVQNDFAEHKEFGDFFDSQQKSGDGGIRSADPGSSTPGKFDDWGVPNDQGVLEVDLGPSKGAPASSSGGKSTV